MPPRTRAAALRKANIARIAVFETVELLEQILLHLPMKDLLLDCRVCKHWQNTIIGSLQIQRALFMKPKPIGCAMRFRFPDRLNKIPGDDSTRFWVAQKAGHDFRLAYLNPLLVEQRDDHMDVLDRAASYGIEVVTALPIKNCRNIKSSGSWQRMYLTQPPETTIEFAIRRIKPRFYTRCLFSPRGVTMGEIIGSARPYFVIKRTKVLDVTGGLELLLKRTRVVADANEMVMLHASTRGKSNMPWTEEDMFSDEDDDEDDGDGDDDDDDDNNDDDEDEDGDD